MYEHREASAVALALAVGLGGAGPAAAADAPPDTARDAAREAVLDGGDPGVGGVAARVLAGEVGAVDDAALCAVAVGLGVVAAQVQLALARVAAELDERAVCDREFGFSTTVWLAQQTQAAPASARGLLRTGRALRRLPVIDAAVADGRVGYDHAEVVGRAANPRVRDALADVQDEIVASARGATFERWRGEVRGLAELLDADGAHDPDEHLARNRLAVARTIDGVTFLRGELVGDHAETVAAAIDQKTDELFRRYHRDHDRCADVRVPDRATLRALALAELCRAGGAVDVSTSAPPRPEVLFVITEDDPDTVRDPVGRAVPAATTATLLCDADFTAVVIDALGVPLDLGRSTRFATAAQRRALAARDGGCIFPGCDLPLSWCDIHHSHTWKAGGTTDLAVLAPLCRRHHGISHRRGWTMTPTADGWFTWTTPTGRTMTSQRHGRQRDHPPPHARAA